MLSLPDLTHAKDLSLRSRMPGMEETNRQLAAFIRTIEQTESNAVDGSTNDGGFQTTTELFKRDHPALNVLKQHIREAVQAYARTLMG
jgi:hypothetical protein